MKVIAWWRLQIPTKPGQPFNSSTLADGLWGYNRLPQALEETLFHNTLSLKIEIYRIFKQWAKFFPPTILQPALRFRINF